MRLIPVSQKVLLCSAWVDSGEYLAAAAKLVAQCQAEVFGIACVRFEQNRRYVLVPYLSWLDFIVLLARTGATDTPLGTDDTCGPLVLSSSPLARLLLPLLLWVPRST